MTWYPKTPAEEADLDRHLLEVVRLLGAKGECISRLGVRVRLSRTVGTKSVIASLGRLHLGGWIEPSARNPDGNVKRAVCAQSRRQREASRLRAIPTAT